MKSQFYMPTKLYQEWNAVQNHAGELASIGKKALIVTGRNSSKKNGSLEDVRQALTQYGTDYLVYDQIDENPTIDMVMDAAQLGRTQGADFVVGVGGGSPLDAAKAIALMIQNRDTSSEVLYQSIPLRALPVVAVPTTCGTGSEVTPFAILTRDDLQTKQSIPHKIFPELALVDPKYLQTASDEVITNTAIDALGHLIESYFNNNAGEYSRMICMTGVEVWGMCRNVLLGMEPERETYENLMLASSLAGMAIAHTGTSLPHGMSYYLTYHKHIPHGKAVGYFLPGYLELFAEEMDVEVMMFLRSMGFGSPEQFRGFIRECIGKLELSDTEREAMIGEIMASERKLEAVPVAVDREQIERLF
ncbi:MAG: iron-containing alcohol dehydrogenase [Lachnospiraceae bacterium]|nr:iron-containing alcohol dehydrogenase [Lachnospiraceae bacterium]